MLCIVTCIILCNDVKILQCQIYNQKEIMLVQSNRVRLNDAVANIIGIFKGTESPRSRRVIYNFSKYSKTCCCKFVMVKSVLFNAHVSIVIYRYFDRVLRADWLTRAIWRIYSIISQGTHRETTSFKETNV